MHVLVVKNTSSEGPGTIEDHLREEQIPYSIIDLSIGDPIPKIDTFTHLVIMGGPMAVYEMNDFPYLVGEAELIHAAINADKPILGVCLGAQMLAHVLGARVYPGSCKEIGWYEVTLTGEGMSDPCISALALPDRHAARVFQWHGDTFDLPERSVRLSSSSLYPNQAFRHGDKVYGLQFHIEVTPVMVRDWLAHEQGIDRASISAGSERLFVSYRRRAMKFYEYFFEI
ncbi:MAG: type 1 glutamine amidotransferase [Deltaproteobacteria bacterium]|nr:type 1 glutamine amidotransferase [Deltaproteobacteria bacterium]